MIGHGVGVVLGASVIPVATATGGALLAVWWLAVQWACAQPSHLVTDATTLDGHYRVRLAEGRYDQGDPTVVLAAENASGVPIPDLTIELRAMAPGAPHDGRAIVLAPDHVGNYRGTLPLRAPGTWVIEGRIDDALDRDDTFTLVVD